MIFLDFSGKNAYTVSHQRQRRGGVDASGKPREEPGGARLRFPGVEGRPRAVDPSVGADVPIGPA